MFTLNNFSELKNAVDELTGGVHPHNNPLTEQMVKDALNGFAGRTIVIRGFIRKVTIYVGHEKAIINGEHTLDLDIIETKRLAA